MTSEAAAFGLADMDSVLELLARVTAPTQPWTLTERKRQLLEGVARLVDADIYIWSASVPNPERFGDVMTVGMMDGGWTSQEQHARVIRALSNPQFAVKASQRVVEAAVNEEYKTFLREEIVSDQWWDENAEFWRQSGLNHLLINVYPLGKRGYSATGLHRFLGRTRFGERERWLVHYALKHVAWFHQNSPQQEEAKPKVLVLSPRERQTLVLLLAGRTKKEIAAELEITEHTVGDYTKKIYRHFAVTSRGELQAIFMSGLTAV
jgi:DNA-binding CsgD family transcriptional regulator